MSTFDKVKDIIIDKLGAEDDKITESASFMDDLGADSLDTVELIMELEEEFGLETPVISISNASFKKENLRFSRNDGTNYLTKEIEKLRQLCWREAGVDRSQKGMSAAFAKVKRDHENACANLQHGVWLI